MRSSLLAGSVRCLCLLSTIVSSSGTAQDNHTLDDRGRENLVAFAQLLGYVRHFHPSDAAAAADWQAFALDGIDYVENARDAAGLAARLERLFAPIAHIRVFPTGTDASLTIEPASHDGLNVYAWEHVGYGGPENERGPYSSRRVKTYEAELSRIGGEPQPGPPFPDPLQPLRVELDGGVTCLVPLALFADDDGSFPRLQGQAATDEREYSADDRATRLAGVILAWNVVQHFYPNFEGDDDGARWLAVLPRYLSEAAEDADADAYLDMLRRMVAELRDGHGTIQPPAEQRMRATLPVTWEWLDDRLVITHVARELVPSHAMDEVDRGDVVHAIDGVPIAEVRKRALARCSAATDAWRDYGSAMHLRFARNVWRPELQLQTPGEDWLRRVPVTFHLQGLATEPRPESFTEVAPGIRYVDLTKIDDDTFAAALPDLQQARGIVFDLRGHPRRLSASFLAHLTGKPLHSPQWLVPRILWPDRRNLAFDEQEWQIEPSEPRLTAKLVFVTDGSAISYAETLLAIVAHHRLGDIVGGATAGTNGNGNVALLPGGYAFVFTGMRTLQQDGSRHHGVGIRPTVPVSRTVEGIQAGRDELLERAIEVVQRER